VISKIVLALLVVLTSGARAQAPMAQSPIVLTPGDVARLVITQSDQAQEINAGAVESELPYALVLGNYDFNLSATVGYTDSKFLNTNTPTYSEETKSWATQILLQKPFTTGTTVGLEIDRNWANSNLLSGVPSTVYDRYTQNIAGLSITQNLWRNFFGRADRNELSAANKNNQAAQTGRLVDLQSLVLDAMRAYWKAYVAQQNFQEALNSRDRYQKLVTAVRRKAGYGYTTAGELPQAEAEYESHVQSVKTGSANYLAAVDALLTLLKLPAGTEIRFKAVEDLPTPPTATAASLDDLRAVKAQRLRKEAADEALVGAKYRDAADLSLVGKAYTSGTDRDANEADRQLTAGNYPQYFIGLRYQYSFGSGLYDAQIRNKEAAAILENSRFDRLRRETGDSLVNEERQLQALYNVALSLRTQKDLREKAVNELTRTYTQGRTDIAILIDAINKSFTTEVDVIRAMGDYQVALNEWAALHDQLIPDSQDAKPAVHPILPGNTHGVTVPAPTPPSSSK
jgi:outer membrane protein TolC